MSLLSKFVVEELESELLSHEPALQDAFLHEVTEFVQVIGAWLKDKIDAKDE